MAQKEKTQMVWIQLGDPVIVKLPTNLVTRFGVKRSIRKSEANSKKKLYCLWKPMLLEMLASIERPKVEDNNQDQELE